MFLASFWNYNLCGFSFNFLCVLILVLLIKKKIVSQLNNDLI